MRTRGAIVTIVPALLAVACLQSGSTEAQENTEARLSAAVNASAPITLQLSQESTEAQMAATRAYWTPERLANARPMLPRVNETAVAAEAASTAIGPPVSFPGKLPTVKIKPQLTNRLYNPALAQIQPEADGIESQAVGTSGARFTSANSGGPFGLFGSFYPHSTTGKLFFTTPTGDAVCSASVLKLRIVVTAGHCVHIGSGGTAGFFTHFMFIPAYRDGFAGLGLFFTPRTVGATDLWMTGGGTVPNAADFGMFDMKDVLLGVPPIATKIGSFTGLLGLRTVGLIPNHTTKLGYPSNLDFGQRMQEVTSQSFRAVAPNNVEYGSNARDGSDGGPWIENFGIQPLVGGVPFAEANRLVGVTSYSSVNPLAMLQGSSIPDGRVGGFLPLLTTMCALRAGNC